MELIGNIIGVIEEAREDDYAGLKVNEIVTYKKEEALKMVKFDLEKLDILFENLSSKDKNKVILAKKLHDKEIKLVNFSKGMLKKDIEYFQTLFKKITSYGRKIILVDKNSEIFLNCVDHIYVIDKEQIIYETRTIFDKYLKKYIDLPKIVEFIAKSEEQGIRLDQYTELDELLKAIYRIKS